MDFGVEEFELSGVILGLCCGYCRFVVCSLDYMNVIDLW